MQKLWRLLLAIFSSSSTANSDASREGFGNLPYRHSEFDMALGWEIKLVGGETRVEGALKNLRYAFMEGIEVWVTVVDAAGSTKARSVCYVIPRQVKQDDIAPFTVKLPAVVEPGMLLKFSYKYDGSDGGEGGVNWMQDFDWIMPAP